MKSASAKPVFNDTSNEYSDGFLYNPCVGFSMASSNIANQSCTNDLLCLEVVTKKYNLTYAGLEAAGSANFVYVNDDLFIYYNSNSAINRTFAVKLICDENEAHGKFMFIGEPMALYYQFNFISMCLSRKMSQQDDAT